MEKLRFSVVYDGAALRDGAMDVKDLAPAMLAVGDLCVRANYLLNGERAKVAVKAKAQFESGSFEVILELWQSIPEALQTVLLDKAIQHGQDILALLGFAMSAESPQQSVKNLIELLKWAHGKLPKLVQDNGDGTVVVENEKGDTAIVNQPTYNAARDQHITNNFFQIIQPLERDGVESFETRENEIVVASVSKEESQMIKPSFVEVETPPLLTTTTRRALEIVKPSFDDSLVWNLQGDPSERFSAKMADPDFQVRVDAREPFAKGDILVVDLETATSKTEKGLAANRRITKVHHHVKPEDAQPSLFAPLKSEE